MKKIIFILCTLLIISCNKDDGGDTVQGCTEELVFGLQITVLNNVTGSPVSSGITVTATEGTYTEDLMFSNNAWIGAAERPGTYEVTVTSTEYTPASTGPITVNSDACHVITEQREIFVSPF